ncbi:hypothetical protein [Yimella sp. cx-51]|uniref:hypothetical protein n=1 Tax=Yimella sp. cx-51 TaxID=2770551 RepID=UPI00165DDB0A|nr:hypothetical protein [Yimella sp. cx-51]MBC9958340.1 hypothetical protein [Yimella sp. cx-51]QTH39759.1 hypothetical protein J5M86_15205 [Yimella sp. cx-51]
MSEITTKAEELLAGRLESVRKLEEARTNVLRAREHLAREERAESQAWAEASAAGWTSAELKKIGFIAPRGRRGGRPATARRQSTARDASSSKGSDHNTQDVAP